MISKILKIFEFEHKKKFFLLIVLLFCSSILEFVGLFLIIPLSAIIFDISEAVNFKYIDDIILILKQSFLNYKEIILFLFLTIFTIKTLILTFTNYYQAKFFSDYTSYLNKKIIKNKLLSNYNIFNIAKAREYFQPLTNETNFFVQRIIQSILIIFSEIPILFLIILLISFEYVEIVSIILLIITIISLVYYLALKKKFQRIGEIRFLLESKRLDMIFQIFSNMRDISLYKKYLYFYDKFKKMDEDYFVTIKNNFFYSRLPKILFEFIFILLITFIFYYFIKNINNTLVFLPTIAFIIAAIIRLMPSFVKLTFAFQSLKFFEKSYNLIYRELQNKSYEEFDISEHPLNFNKEIYLKDISFNYGEKVILKNINLEIIKNKTIGIIGESGSGKSTLLKIISGFLKPLSGTIAIDGKDIPDKDFQKLSNICSVISGESDLINDTILKNIAFGIEEDQINFNKAYDCASLSNIFNFFVKGNHISKKEILNYQINEQGKNLSDGQKQRIKIARALYFDRQILILDEATNSLDSKNEEDIFKILSDLSKEKTIIIVSHNSKNLKKCNYIYEFTDNEVFKIK